MKQVKSLLLSAFLVMALTVSAHAGDISSPGAKTPRPSGNSQISVEIVESNSMLIDETESVSDQVMMDILLALFALI